MWRSSFVFSGIDFKRTEELCIQAHNALKKFKGENAEMIGGTKDNVCIDAAFLSRHEDVLMASHGYRNNGNQRECSIQVMVGVALKMEIRKKEEEVNKEKSLPKKKNPSGPKGHPWTCHYCGYEYHIIGNCD